MSQDKAAQQIKNFGILNSVFGKFLKRVDGKPDPSENTKLTSSSSSFASDESVKGLVDFK